MSRSLVWVTDDSLDASAPQGRAGRIIGFKLSEVRSAALSAGATAAPTALSVATVDGTVAKFDVDVKASSLFYDDEQSTSEVLWVGEFHQPDTQAATKVSSRPKLSGKPAKTKGSAQSTGAVKARNVGSPPTSGSGPSKGSSGRTRQPLTLASPVDKRASPSPVASHHSIALTGESGWVAGYKLNLANGLPQAAVSSSTYKPPGYTSHPVLRPDHIVEVGSHVRGVCFFRRLGINYIAVTRCAYAKGFPCAVEFHFLPDPASVRTGSYTFSESYTLDPGLPPSRPAAKPKGQRGSSSRRQRRSKPKSDAAPGQKPEDKNVEFKGTVALKMRVPMGADSLHYYSDAKSSFFSVTFSSGSVAMQDQVARALGDTEDSFFTFSPPALRTQKPAVNENVMFVKLLGADIVAPRCVIPVGDKCKKDKTAQGDSTTEASGQKKPSRKLLSELAATLGTVSATPRDPFLLEDDAGVPRPDELADSERAGRALAPVHGRRLAEGDEEEVDSCIYATAPLYSASVQFIRWETVIIVMGVPIFFFFEAGGTLDVSFRAGLCLADKLVRAAIVPTAGLYAEVGGGVTLVIIKAGMKIRATLMETSLVPEARLGLLKGGAIRACLALDLIINPLAIDIIGFVELWLCPYFKKVCASLGFVEICIPIPFFFKFCDPFEVPIFSWAAKPITINIFTICNRPADITPPEGGFVEAAQVDASSLTLNWGGFEEPDGEVESYTVCVGTSPGSQSILECQDEGTGTSATYNDLVFPDGGKVYATVIAVNAEGLETGKSAVIQADASAPEVVNIQVRRTLDDKWASGDWTYHNDPQIIAARFQVRENVKTSNISMVQYCIGTTPGEDDIAECNDIGCVLCGVLFSVAQAQ